MSSDRTIKISDAYELMSKKILIARMSIELAKNQILLSEASIKIQQHAINVSKERIKLLEKVCPILEKQLSEFDEIRHQECVDIYGYIDELDEYSPEITKAFKDCDKYNEEMRNLYPKIQHIESTIPTTKEVTNYKIKDVPATNAHNCAAEVAMLGGNSLPDVE